MHRLGFGPMTEAELRAARRPRTKPSRSADSNEQTNNTNRTNQTHSIFPQTQTARQSPPRWISLPFLVDRRLLTATRGLLAAIDGVLSRRPPVCVREGGLSVPLVGRESRSVGFQGFLSGFRSVSAALAGSAPAVRVGLSGHRSRVPLRVSGLGGVDAAGLVYGV